MNGIFYKIKYGSMDQFYGTMATRLSDWFAQLNDWENAYNRIVNMNSFQGAMAENSKAYLNEVHATILYAIKQVLTTYQSDFLLYKTGFYGLESNIYASLSEEELLNTQVRLGNEATRLDSLNSNLQTILRSINDIFGYAAPSNFNVKNTVEGLQNDIIRKNREIELYEDTQYTVAVKVDELIEQLWDTVDEYLASSVNPSSYQSGSIVQNINVLNLMQRVKTEGESVSQNQEKIEKAVQQQQQVYVQMQEDYEAACAARRDKGTAEMIMGGVAVVAGVVAIVGTAGMATPVVVTAAVAGSCTVAYGASNFSEGVQDVYYGYMGDIGTAAINPIRDTVFCGNQELYDMWGSVNMTVASLCVPVGTAVGEVSGGKAIVEAAIKTIVKETVKDQASDLIVSNAGSFLTEQFNWNQTQSTLFNVIAGFAMEKGMDGLESVVTKVDAGKMGSNDAKVDIDNTKVEVENRLHSDLNEIEIGKGDLLQGEKISIEGKNPSSRDSLISRIESGEVKLETNIQKGNYGEMKMDAYYESMGYKRLSTDSVTDIDAPNHHGIDGVYYKPDGKPPYIIAEAKYGSSKLSKLSDNTMQMSNKWIIDRLEASVGEVETVKIRLEMTSNPENVGSVLFHIDSSGGTINVSNLLDCGDGKVKIIK